MSLYLFVVEFLDEHLSSSVLASDIDGKSAQQRLNESAGAFMVDNNMPASVAVTGGKLPGLVAKHAKLLDAALLRSDIIPEANFTIEDRAHYNNLSILQSKGRTICALVDANDADPIIDVQPLIEEIFYPKLAGTVTVNTAAARIRGPFRWFAFRLDEPTATKLTWTVNFLKPGGNGGDR